MEERRVREIFGGFFEFSSEGKWLRVEGQA